MTAHYRGEVGDRLQAMGKRVIAYPRIASVYGLLPFCQ